MISFSLLKITALNGKAHALKSVALIAFILILVQGVTNNAKAQPAQKTSKIYIGCGSGWDYGGFGAKTEFLLIDHLGLFVGTGYNIDGVGFKGGISYKILPQREITPVIIGVYGYDAFIVNKHVSEIASSGFSLGGGAEFDMGRRRKNKISALFIVPFRDIPFRKVDFRTGNSNALLFSVSVGYSWGF